MFPSPEALIARKTDSEPVPEPVTLCAWCKDFDRTAAANRGASHGLCPRCFAQQAALLDAKENG
jgi:hypothetical protein